MKKNQSEFIEAFGDDHENIVVRLVRYCLAYISKRRFLDLNHIYLASEGKAFVSIDGQNNLIILWLSHLYIYTRHGKDFPISLQFKSREFADNFSKKLKSELNTILEMQDTEYKKLVTKSKTLNGL